MTLLLDTHIFIWYSVTADKLSKSALDAINDEENALYLSQVSIWEMQIKQNLGKLVLPSDIKSMVKEQLAVNAFELLQIKNEHFWQLASLPKLHKDPFDRLLVCQAQKESLTMVTCDSKISGYGIDVLW
jgi:PIN domain nuclease of toxin-antitoxin system